MHGRPGHITFALHEQDRDSLLLPVFESLKEFGYEADLTSTPHVAGGMLLTFKARADQDLSMARAARVMVIADVEWESDPFDGDWHAEDLPPPYKVSAAHSAPQGVRPIIIRCVRRELPVFLLPAVVPDEPRIEACNVIDAFCAPQRLPVALSEKLGLLPRDPALDIAEALLVQSNWSLGLLYDLADQGKATTVEALQMLDSSLDRPTAALLAAIAGRDVRAARKTLDHLHGRLPRFRLGGGNTLLHFAAYFPRNSEVIALLLQAGGDCNARSATGATPLLPAVWKAPNDEPLIEAGADVRAITLEGETLLAVSAWKGYIQRVTRELTAGVSPFLTDNNGGHALLWAAHANRLDIVALIISRYPGHVDVRTGELGMGSQDPDYSWDRPGLAPLTSLRRWRAAHSSQTSMGRTALMVSVSDGHKEIVEYLLTHHANPNITDRSGVRALHFAPAADQHAAAIIVALIAAGAEVNAQEEGGTSALIAAAVNNKPDIVALLVDKKAEVDLADKQGQTALHFAANRGYVEVVRRLLQLGAAPSLPDGNGFTPLHHAVSANERAVETIQALLEERRVFANERDRRGRTPLALLISSGTPDAQREAVALCLIENGADPNGMESDGRSILSTAIVSGDSVLVAVLLKKGAKLSQEGESRVTPLHVAVLAGHNHIVEQLLLEKADANVRDGLGESPLHDAVRKGNSRAWEMLLAHGGDPWASADSGPCPALLAALKNRSEFCEPLFQALDLRRPHSRNCGLALICAAALGLKDEVRSLLAAGVPIDFSSPEGARAITAATVSDQSEVIELLLTQGAAVDWGAGVPTALSCAAQRGNLTVVRRLLAAQADPNTPALNGWTPIFFAVTNGHVEVLQELLRAGAFVDTRAEDGSSPLHAMVTETEARTDIAEILVRAGARMDARDHDGDTPLHLVAAQGKAELLRWFVGRGAAFDLTNNAGHAPIAVAAAEGQRNCLEILLEEPQVLRSRLDAEGLSLLDIAKDRATMQVLCAAGVTSTADSRLESELAAFLTWHDMEETQLQVLQTRLRRLNLDEPDIGEWLDSQEGRARYARLPFYRETRLIALPGASLCAPVEIFLIERDNPSSVVVLDWSASRVFDANRVFGWKIDASTVVCYLKFLLFFVRQESHSLRVVEPGDALPWLPSADDRLSHSVQELLRPASVSADSPPGTFCIEFTCLFKNTLLSAAGYLAARDVEVADPQSEKIESYRPGEFRVFKQSSLMDGLPVRAPMRPRK